MYGRRLWRGRLRLYRGRRFPWPGAVLLLAACVSGAVFLSLSHQMRPVIRAMAVSRATNLISAAIAEAVDEGMTALSLDYSDLVHIQRDESGQVISLSGDVQAGSSLKRRVLDSLTLRLAQIEPDELGIPLGTLTGRMLLSGLGPSVRVSIQGVGDAAGSFRSSFLSAGINQTCHRIELDLTVRVTLVIPGEIVPVTVEDSVPVAETVIVGQVPDTYIQLDETNT